ncbi:MAG: GIY-YIG nuclease family protein [Chloroflexota bacterium]
MAAHLDLLRLEARSLPQTPGVYFWKDAGGRLLYIGKAVNLRSRVGSYFSNASRDRRTRELLGRARHISFEVTGTELEALFRESALIKKEQPPYNRALRQAKRLYYLKFDTTRDHPFMEMSRGEDDTGALTFGPFPSAAVTRETMAFLHDVLPLRKCTAARPRCRPCLYYQMNKCAAPLIDVEHQARHEEAIGRLYDLLDGRADRVAGWLEAKRDRLSDSLLYEQAAEMQVRLDALNDHRRQHAIMEAAVRCRCVLVGDAGQEQAEGKVLLVAQGHVLSVRSIIGLTAESLATWLAAHEPVIAAAKYEQNELDAAAVLERWLHGGRRRLSWVAIRNTADSPDLRDRCGYILQSASSLRV